MFCPQCGQQSSDEIRFCPRCGLSLVPHAALLAAAHTMASVPTGAPAPALTKKRISTRRAAKLLFFSIVLIPVFLGFSLIVGGGELMLIPVAMFLAGLAWLIYARLFGDEQTYVPREPSRRDLGAVGDRPALGPQQFVPASSFGQQPGNTAEMVPPPSVTENSTRLLDKDV